MKKLAFLLFFALPALAQVAVIPYRTPRATFTTSTGQPLSGGCVFTYQGGTSTPQVTYTDYTGGTPNSNPVILDTTGSAIMWLGPNNYKFVVYSAGGTNCATGALQYTVDQVTGDAFLNATISGATITNATISGGTQSGTALSGVTIASSAIDSTPIGGTTPASGSFTSFAGAVDAMSFSATPVFAAGSYTTFTMTLTANVTSSTITGGLLGQIINFRICQNGTGGYTFAWPASFLNAPVVQSAASACISPQFFYDGANWDFLAQPGVVNPNASARAIVVSDLTNNAYTASQAVGVFYSPVAGTIPAGGTGTYNGVAAASYCYLTTAATASTTFNFADNGTTFGSVNFSIAGTTGTITIASAQSVAQGDKITILAPGSPDATAAGLNCSLVFAY